MIFRIWGFATAPAPAVPAIAPAPAPAAPAPAAPAAPLSLLQPLLANTPKTTMTPSQWG